MVQEIEIKVDTMSIAAKVSNYIVIGLFSVLLMIPGLAQLRGIGGGVLSENRTLAPFPVIKKIREIKYLPKNLENYINDRFGMRRQLVHLNSLVRYKFGLSSRPDIVIGKDGWLFYAADNILEQHAGVDVFKPLELERWVSAMEAVQAWLEKRNISFYILIAPDKNTIYLEKIPQYPRHPAGLNRVDQVVERLRGSRVLIIDPRAELIAAKERGEAVYFEGDSHWTQLGAFVAYEKLIGAIVGSVSGVNVLTRESYNFSVNENPARDLVSHLALERDINHLIPKMTLKQPSHEVGATETLMKSGWGWRVTVTPNDLAGSPRLLVFGDSFTDYVLGPQMLYESFRSPVWTHHNGGTLNLNLVDEYKPDVVVVQMAERYLRLLPHKSIGME